MKSIVFIVGTIAALVSGTSVEECSASVTAILTKAGTNEGATACHADTGISRTATSVSDADVKKAAGSEICNKWWNEIVKDIKGVEPSCKFARFDGSGATDTTSKFRMKYKSFLKMMQKVAAAGTTTKAAKPDYAALEKCGKSVSTILTTATSNHGAKACSKESGIGLGAKSVSSAEITKAAKSPACKKWWQKIVKDIQDLSPACDFPSLDGSANILNTGKFKMTYTEFLEMGKKLMKEATKSKSGKSAPSTGTKDAASSSSPTTTAAPTTTVKSSAVISTLGMATVAIVALFT